MAPVAFRTLAAALGVSLAAQAGGSEAPPPRIDFLEEDVARQAEVVQATMMWQVEKVKQRLTVLTNDALQHSRRLQSTSPCLWSNMNCDLNPAYLTEKAAQLPQGSPSSMAVAMDMACGTIKDSMKCNSNTSCTWNDSPGMCNVNVDQQMNNVAASLFDPATCGSSDGAMLLKNAMAPSMCDPLGKTDCKANAKCDWSKGYKVTGNTCTMMESCSKGSSSDTSTVCPASYNATMAAVTCLSNAALWGNATAIMLCTTQGCPILYNVMLAQIALMSTCGPLTKQSDCNANSKCMWQMDQSSSSMNMTCQGNIDIIGIALQSVPDSCKLKGLFLQSGKCGSKTSQATCTGDCSWTSDPICGPTGGPVQTTSTCGPSPAAVSKGMTDIAGNSPASLLAQARASCQSATSQASCSNVSRPSEGPTTTSGTMGPLRQNWFAAPSMLAALIVSAGVQSR